jgi:hypothetical protein
MSIALMPASAAVAASVQAMAIAYRHALVRGHEECVLRENLSSVVLKESYRANGENALLSAQSAIGTLGGKHAPISLTQEFLMHAPELRAQGMIVDGDLIPGWGCAFVKGEPDEIWNECDELLRQWPELWETKVMVTDCLHSAGKRIYPNAAFYTACYAIIEKIPSQLADLLVLEMRSTAWRELLTETFYRKD